MNERRSRSLTFIFGLASGLVISAAGLGIYSTALKFQWNTTAIAGHFSEVLFDTESDGVTMQVAYRLRNNTDREYKLPGSPSDIMILSADQHSLYSIGSGPDPYAVSAAMSGPGYIPPRREVLAQVSIKYRYNDYLKAEDVSDEKKLAAYFAARLKNVGGFEIFDHVNRYDIRLPAAWPK